MSAAAIGETMNPPHRIRTGLMVLAVVAITVVSTVPAPTAALPEATAAVAQTSTRIQIDEVAPADRVDLLYRDLLGRRPDPAGGTAWSNRLASGMPTVDVVESIVDSKEVAGAFEPVIRLYRSALLRSPDHRGLQRWVAVSRRGRSLPAIAESFARSPEFVGRYGSLSDAEFIIQIYRNVLGRPPDPAGKTHWTRRLNAGASRGDILVAFSESIENRNRTSVATRMNLLTATLLRRGSTPVETSAWLDRDPSVTMATLIDEVITGAEYEKRLAQTFSDRHPLTGEWTAQLQPRPALAVKIDNVDRARPQIGLNEADIVYEEMVEGQLTRLVGLFHSRTPATVGPVRSVRSTDFDVLAPYRRPLLAASGANPGVLAALGSAPVTNRTALVSPHYWRHSSRRAPHNLMTDPADQWASAPNDAKAPPPMLTTAADPSTGPAVEGATIEFGSATAQWRWQDSTGVWRRNQNGTAHVDANGTPVGAENVAIMITRYTPSAIDANSPEAHTVGRGRAFILTEGELVTGYWQRNSATDPIAFVDGKDRAIRLRPGQTWIELAPPTSLTIDRR